jgi:hypothetical protein
MKTNLKTSLATALLCAGFTIELFAGSTPLEIWTWRNPLPTGNQLNSATYADGQFVAVGEDGAIVTSPDGINWEQQIAPPNTDLAAVTYGSGTFVAVGVDALSQTTNVILTSPDGANWTTVNLPAGATNGFRAVAYGGSYFVAVGNGGTVWYSSDGGTNWNPVSSGTTFNLNAVTYAVNKFTAAGDNSTILTSSHGQSWTAATVTGNNGESFGGIAYGDGKFVAVGDFSGFFYSSDGGTWTKSTNGLYGDSIIYAEVNGTEEFVAASTTTFAIVTSLDGINWTDYSGPPSFNSIAAGGNNTFVGVGYDAIYTNFTDITAASDWGNVAVNVSAGQLEAIVYGTAPGGKGLFVAGGKGYNQLPAIVTSTNGYNWQLDTNSSLTNFSQFYNAFVNGLAVGNVNESSNSSFVATLNTAGGFTGVNSEIISSSDGITWSTNYSTAYYLNAIAFGPTGGFVAVADGGLVFDSKDTITWNSHPSGTVYSLEAITYGSGHYVTVGSFGTTAWSSDGVNWNPVSDGDTNQEELNGVAYGDGEFVASGRLASFSLPPTEHPGHHKSPARRLILTV